MSPHNRVSAKRKLCFDCDAKSQSNKKKMKHLSGALPFFVHEKWRLEQMYPGFVTAHHTDLDCWYVYLCITPGYDVEVHYRNEKVQDEIGSFKLNFDFDDEGLTIGQRCADYLAALTQLLPDIVKMATKACDLRGKQLEKEKSEIVMNMVLESAPDNSDWTFQHSDNGLVSFHTKLPNYYVRELQTGNCYLIALFDSITDKLVAYPDNDHFPIISLSKSATNSFAKECYQQCLNQELEGFMAAASSRVK
jgi:hypothetical protein